MAKMDFTFKVGGVPIKEMELKAPLKDGVSDLLISDPVDVPDNYPNGRFTLQWTALLPNTDTIFPTFSIDAMIEGQNADGDWYLIANMFESFKYLSSGAIRILVVGFPIESGHQVDDISWLADQVYARHSAVNSMIGKRIRLRIILKEDDKAAVGHFESVKLSAFGEVQD